MFDTTSVDFISADTSFDVDALSIDDSTTEVSVGKVYTWGNLTDTSMLEIVKAGKTTFTKEWLLNQFALPTDYDDLTVKQARKVEMDFVNYFYHGVQKVMLKKHCVLIDNDPIVSGQFLVIPPEQQAKHASKKATKKAMAQINKGIVGVTYIDEAKLTEGQLKETDDQRSRFGMLASTFKTATKEFKNLGGRKVAAKAAKLVALSAPAIAAS